MLAAVRAHGDGDRADTAGTDWNLLQCASLPTSQGGAVSQIHPSPKAVSAQLGLGHCTGPSIRVSRTQDHGVVFALAEGSGSQHWPSP